MTKSDKLTWRTMVDIFGIEPPTTAPSKDYPHVSQQGLFVRVGRTRRDGKVRRTYVVRHDQLQPDGTFKNGKSELGLVEEMDDGNLVISLKDALAAAAKVLEDTQRLKSGGSVRMTVGDAYAKLCESLDSPVATDSPGYADKMKGVYNRFLFHLAPRHLDSLKEGFWIDFLARLREGKLQVGTETDADGKEAPMLREAKSVTYAVGILNAVSRLYRLAHEYRGIEGESKDWDPTRAAADKLEAPNVRESFVKFEDLPAAWAATDQLMSPWWRDLWRVYLLTGLRDRLVMDMRWDQLDLERGIYYIDPLAPGAKRRRKKLSQEERKKPIEMPLSSYVVALLKRRKVFAPKGPAGEWVWFSTETIRRKETDTPRLTDPRSSWKRIEPLIGYWVYKHGLRRSFASIAATVDPASVLALSLLLLHSSKTVSTALGVPQITVEYIKGQHGAMRAMTEKVSRAVLELVGELPPTDLTASIREYGTLPAHLNQVLNLEEKAPTRGDDFGEDIELPAHADS